MAAGIKKFSAPAEKSKKTNYLLIAGWVCIALIFGALFSTPAVFAVDLSGIKVYERISKAVNTEEGSSLIQNLNQASKKLDWSNAEKIEFPGNLRIIGNKYSDSTGSKPGVYLIRKENGEIYILDMPRDPKAFSADSSSAYASIDDAYENKMTFKIQVVKMEVAGEAYAFAQLLEKPEQTALDRVFKAGIVLLLFFVMVGMGMTLTMKDFKLVFKTPRSILIGQILQFALMPFLAMALGRLFGFYEEYPFIYVGLILITATPGGVTSNLMTYYAKGDLALSISLTSLSTVLSLIFTPLLLAVYCSNMMAITIPVQDVVQTILILVIIPLIVGMSFKWKWSGLADKLKPVFSLLGIIALLVLILAGTLGNLEVYTDTTRYGTKFYFTVFSITMLGMLFGILFSKLSGINNYQTRAISLETGLRNSALAMTIALLIQDPMGDFYSSMLITSGVFGLVMFLAGTISIYLYKFLLPIEEEVELEPVIETPTN